jgi:hypothetical protein
MALIRVRFRCGHVAQIDPDKMPSPVCGHCGERAVAGVVGVPPPSIRGVASGPLVETQKLDAIPVSLTSDARPLVLKDRLQESSNAATTRR